MSGWLLVVDRPNDLPALPAGLRVLTTREYATRPELFRGRAPKVINLSRSYSYQSTGYYGSLLAEARGHRVLPTVDTILELAERSLYRHTLAEFEAELARIVRRMAEPPEGTLTLLVCFGLCEDRRFAAFSRQLFDRFRCPILELRARLGESCAISRLRPQPVQKLTGEQARLFEAALARFTGAGWRRPKARAQPRFTLAVLHDPREQLPPSRPASLERLKRVAEPMGLGVEVIGRKDYLRLPEYDALLIRATTSIEDYTFRFAKRAEQEGLPVIDDPTSILRCTNKVYLAEVLASHGVPVPKTAVVDGLGRLASLEERLGFPIVLKIPDASFSRGVFKAESAKELHEIAARLLDESDLIVAQEFMYTTYDWRIGVLEGEPLFACQYLMARNHWQILKHGSRRPIEGGFRTLGLDNVPIEVIDTAVRASRLIGDGLYGVDLKQNERGVFVIEVNDNPNLDHGIEDAVLKDELWRRLASWFLTRLR